MKKLLILVFGMLLFFGGCEDKSLAKKNQENEIIKIGVVTPLTGDASSWGIMQKNATLLALKDINYQIKDKKVKVIFEDSKATPKDGLSASKKLIEYDKVEIVVGFPASNVTLAVSSLFNNSEKILLSSGSTAKDVGKAGDYIFRIMPSDETQAILTANWIKELKLKKLAMVYTNNAWGKGLADEFKKQFKGNLLTISVKQEDNNFKSIITKISNSDINAIYAPLYPKQAGQFLKQLREVGFTKQVIGADVYGSPEFLETAKEFANGVKYITFSKYNGKENKDFEIRYEKQFKIKPDNYASYCYDAFKIAVKAIEMSSNYDAKEIRKNLLQINNFTGATGITSFNGNNSASGKKFEKIIIKNLKHVRIK